MTHPPQCNAARNGSDYRRGQSAVMGVASNSPYETGQALSTASNLLEMATGAALTFDEIDFERKLFVSYCM